MGNHACRGHVILKILFCIKAMNSSGGGAERVLAEVASGLAKLGNDVYLLSFDDIGGESFYPLHPSIRRINLGSGPESESSKSFRILRLVLIMRRLIRRLDPDVAIGFMHSMYIPLGLASLGTGVPAIASEHIVSEHYRSRPMQALLLYLAPFIVSKITCVSEQAKQASSPFLRGKMVVVPNPVTLSIEGKSDVAGERRQRKTLLTVGRLDAQKDHKVLIEAFSQIAADLPEWDLRIIGEGELRRDLENQVSDLGLEGRVLLPGGTKEISKEYQAAQLYGQPSRYESYGLTVVEALSHGLPAVGFDDCIGVNQLIRPCKNGLLVDGKGNRAVALARGLRTLMFDGDLRAQLSKGGAILLEENHIDRVVDNWAHLLGTQAVKPNLDLNA